MWRLAFKNTLRRKGQSILTVIITTLTILTFVIGLSVFWVIQEGLNLSSNRLGADIMLLPNKAKADANQALFTANPANIYMDSGIIDKVSKVSGIDKISPQFFTQTLEGGCCSYGEAIRIVGYDDKTDFILKPWFNQQKFKKLKKNEVVIGSKVETFLGDRVSIISDIFNVVGTLYPTGSGMDETIYMNIDSARRIVKDVDELKGLWKDAQPERLVSAIFIKAKPGADIKKIEKSISDLNLNVKFISTSETIGNVKVQIETFGKIILGLWVALLLIAALALIGRFNSLANERKKEIGLLRAMGVQKSSVLRLILIEAWLMAGVGGIIGSILGTICTTPILNELKDALTLPVGTWSFATALKCGGIGILAALLLGFIASIYPALKSASLEPQRAITQGELD
ncbi:ABC transporter permease [Clostridium cylindrosporum]|uniref:ABC-type transport system, involved in lipoprotein release, permease component n=1 Tax=Clostridium cylindrosporum DSM 605 TaxID=1121307 RepID=A0A0J8D914_CLOCY|nr:FtsX-like permease family protein [Clostridium cylindrosporum]KMT22510.1 ABC-type transport system, involved in lipoprotein release, permease component [Clostridium cylindrosporum DSM 605]